MNKFGIFASASLLVVAAASCNVESIETVAPKDTVPSGQISFKASFADVASKTSYQDVEGMLKTKWAANDSISVITYFQFDDGSQSQYVEYVDNFYSNCAEGSEIAEFTGTLTEIPSGHVSLQAGGVVKRICYYPALSSDSTYEGWDNEANEYGHYPLYSQYAKNTSYNDVDAGDKFFGLAASKTGMVSWTYRGPGGFLCKGAPFDGMNRNDVMTGMLEGDVESGLSVRLKKQTYVLKLELDLSGHEGEKIYGYRIGCSTASFAEAYIEFAEDGNLNYYPDYDDCFFSAIYSDGAYTVPSDGKVTAYVSSKVEFTAEAGSAISISVLRAKDGGSYQDGVIASSISAVTNALECKKGYVYTIKSSFKSQTSEKINIPDPTFKAFLLTTCDLDCDGEISKQEATMLAVIDPYNVSDIQSFEGIEHCINANTIFLNGAGAAVKDIDFSKFPKLERLELGKCGFESFDASKLENLTSLYMSDNNMSSIDVSKNAKLEYLYLGDNALTDIDLSNNKELQYLRLSNNKLTTIDVSKNQKLEDLHLSGCPLVQLDVTHNENLVVLECDECELAQLDLSHNVKLRSVSCMGREGSANRLTSIDLSHCPDIWSLDVSNQNIAELDLSNSSEITYLYCRDCINLSQVKVYKSVNSFYIEGCSSLMALDLQGCSKLVNLNCSKCNLTTLNLQGCSKLVNFYCQNNRLTSLDVTDCRDISYIYCMHNLIRELDLTTLRNPYGVNCSGMLDSNGNNVLEKIYVSDPNYSSWLYAPGVSVIVK